jgi:hypothetical protein
MRVKRKKIVDWTWKLGFFLRNKTDGIQYIKHDFLFSIPIYFKINHMWYMNNIKLHFCLVQYCCVCSRCGEEIFHRQPVFPKKSKLDSTTGYEKLTRFLTFLFQNKKNVSTLLYTNNSKVCSLTPQYSLEQDVN